jgi:hypothetical protein
MRSVRWTSVLIVLSVRLLSWVSYCWARIESLPPSRMN